MNIIQQNTKTHKPLAVPPGEKSQLIIKIRPNLYQLPQGQLVGFGPLESENGTSTCWTCFEPECIHVEAITQAWLGGMSVEAQSGTFNGYHTPSTVTAPPMASAGHFVGSTVVTQADIDAVNDGNRPGAWRARTIEEMPQGWPTARVLR